MAPESKQSFLFTGVRAHARLQFRLRHPPRFIVPQLIRLSYRRNTAPPLRSIKFANRPGEIRRDTPVPTNYRPNEIDTLEIRSLVKTEREKKKRENSRSTTKMISSILRGATSILFSFFLFFEANRLENRLPGLSIRGLVPEETRSVRSRKGGGGGGGGEGYAA